MDDLGVPLFQETSIREIETGNIWKHLEISGNIWKPPDFEAKKMELSSANFPNKTEFENGWLMVKWGKRKDILRIRTV